ncbi:hypothetical protein CPC08DRAFT_713496 [Agrocybe pediades]|nr:hypothetical protein CPC08DRAFT_713496 [Agrocybe pediades]
MKILDWLVHALKSDESQQKATERLILYTHAWMQVIKAHEEDSDAKEGLLRDFRELLQIIKSGDASELGTKFKVNVSDFLAAKRLFEATRAKFMSTTSVHKGVIMAAVASSVSGATGMQEGSEATPDNDGASVSRRIRVEELDNRIRTAVDSVIDRGASLDEGMARLSSEFGGVDSHGRISYERFALVDRNSPYFSGDVGSLKSGSGGQASESIASWDMRDRARHERRDVEVGFNRVGDFDNGSQLSYQVGSEIVFGSTGNTSSSMIDSAGRTSGEGSGYNADSEGGQSSELSHEIRRSSVPSARRMFPGEYMDWKQVTEMLFAD